MSDVVAPIVKVAVIKWKVPTTTPITVIPKFLAAQKTLTRAMAGSRRSTPESFEARRKRRESCYGKKFSAQTVLEPEKTPIIGIIVLVFKISGSETVWFSNTFKLLAGGKRLYTFDGGAPNFRNERKLSGELSSFTKSVTFLQFTDWQHGNDGHSR